MSRGSEIAATLPRVMVASIGDAVTAAEVP